MISTRRQYNRIDTHWRARVLKKGQGIVSGVIENASIGGVFVRTSLRLSLHDFILLEFETSDEKPLRRVICECEVLRCVEADGSGFGYGLRFHRMKDEDITYLLDLIARRWMALSEIHPREPVT
jgi:hypothetical protein